MAARHEPVRTTPAAGKASDCDVVVSRVLDAPRELVWKAWTDPRHVARWWGPHGFTNPVCELDVRPGGAQRIVMRAPDGTEYPCTGVYREVMPPERLVYADDMSEMPEAWHDLVNPDRDRSRPPTLECLVTVTFESQGSKTLLTIRTRFASPAIRDAMAKMQMVEGWTESLERLAAVLAEAATSPQAGQRGART